MIVLLEYFRPWQLITFFVNNTYLSFRALSIQLTSPFLFLQHIFFACSVRKKTKGNKVVWFTSPTPREQFHAPFSYVFCGRYSSALVPYNLTEFQEFWLLLAKYCFFTPASHCFKLSSNTSSLFGENTFYFCWETFSLNSCRAQQQSCAKNASALHLKSLSCEYSVVNAQLTKRRNE